MEWRFQFQVVIRWNLRLNDLGDYLLRKKRKCSARTAEDAGELSLKDHLIRQIVDVGDAMEKASTSLKIKGVNYIIPDQRVDHDAPGMQVHRPYAR